MKRFTETEKWKDPWFRGLKGAHKLVFLYIVDNCNNAGFYEVDEAMIVFQTGLESSHIQGAWKGLERGLKGASGWVWVRRFLRHQKHEPLNPENPAHRQIISMLAEQVERFSDCREFSEFIAPYKGLLSPIGKGEGKGKGGEGMQGEATKRALPTLHEAVSYGAEIGMDAVDVENWFDHFQSNGWKVSGKAPMKDWRAGLRNGKRMLPKLNGTAPKIERGQHGVIREV